MRQATEQEPMLCAVLRLVRQQETPAAHPRQHRQASAQRLYLFSYHLPATEQSTVPNTQKVLDYLMTEKSLQGESWFYFLKKVSLSTPKATELKSNLLLSES